MASTIDAVRSLAEPVVTSRGFELYDIEQNGPVLRVTVAGPLGGPGPSIDELGAISRELSRALDAADPVSGRYTLEVSSPGLERRLRTPEHFRRAVGETVTVKVRLPGEPTRRVRGVVADADDDAVVLRPDADDADDADTSDVERLAYATIDTARTVFEWGMTPPDKSQTDADPDGDATRRPDR